MVALPARQVWRRYNIDLVPGSGPYSPEKGTIVDWAEALEALTRGAQAGGAVTFSTLAEAMGNLQFGIATLAFIVSDPTSANNGIYQKQGAPNTGFWSRLQDLPYSFIRFQNTGAGNANGIVATSTLPASQSALIALNITTTNTSPNVTVKFNNDAPLPIKTASGNTPAVGGLVAGTIVAGYSDGSAFRLLSDQASTAIQAAAEAAKTAAETARNLAVQAADQAAVVGAGDVPTYGSIALAQASTIPSARQYVLVMGKANIGDLRMPLMFVRRTGPSSGLGFRSTDRQLPANAGSDATNGGYWEARTLRFTPQMFGALADGTTNDAAAFIAAGAALSALGGGILEVPAGTYGIGLGGVLLTSLSNVCVAGVGGRGSRLKKLPGFAGIAALVFAGCDNCSAIGIFADSVNEDSNGIAATTSSPYDLTGTRSSNIHIMDCEVTLEPAAHNYGIAMFLVQGGSVLRNRVDGQTTSFTTAGEQEGIECFGCTNFLVAFNRLRRLSGSALSIFSQAGIDSAQSNIQMIHNAAEDCYGLAWINPSMGRTGSGTRYNNNYSNIEVAHNTGRRIFGRGVYFMLLTGDGTVDAGVTVENVQVVHNSVVFATAAEGAVATSFAMASFLATNTNGSTPDLTKFTVTNVLHAFNRYSKGFDCGVAGLSMVNMEGVESHSNVYDRVGGSASGSLGAYLEKTDGCRVIGEVFRRMNTYGMLVQGSNGALTVDRNEFVDWDMGNAGVPAILFNTGSSSVGLVVRENIARRINGTAVAETIVGVASSPDHDNFEIGGNRYIGAGNLAAEVSFTGAPGDNGNRGTVTMAGGATNFTVVTNRCSADSTVIVTQETGGTARAVTLVTPGDGQFTASISGAADGARYRWRIL